MGGAADIVARQITQKLGQALGTQFVVDNRAGVGGAIGSEIVAPAVIDTISGDVSLLFAAYPSISAQARAGKLRALAVTSA